MPRKRHWLPSKSGGASESRPADQRNPFRVTSGVGRYHRSKFNGTGMITIALEMGVDTLTDWE